MDTDALLQLNTHFQLPNNALHFDALPNGFCIAHLRNQYGVASISIQGAHVLNWQPADQQIPVLWLSPDARFEQGKSIRGGIPVCWPWFGAHADNERFPAHGFARASPWEVVSSSQERDGTVRFGLRLLLEHGKEFWAADTRLELNICLGATLSLELTTQNFGAYPVFLGEALHTYFKISDIENITVTGLDGNEYWDTVGEVTKRTQRGEVRFAQETDRVYINSPASVVIEDPAWQRRIHIKKSDSLATVVWNPWIDKANRMGDLGQPDGWREFVCVESANAWDNKVRLEPGDVHTMSVEYGVSPR